MREVKRKAKVGEYIKIVDANDYELYSNGDIFKVESRDEFDDDGVTTENDEQFIYDKEYVVLEDYKPNKFKVGDRVKTCYGFGTIKNIVVGKIAPILVKHDDWLDGHNGNGVGTYVSDRKDCYWFCQESLELIEKEQEKVSYIRTKYFKENLCINDIKIQQPEHSYITKIELTPDGIFMASNNIELERKEEKDMNKVLELYKERKLNKLSEKYIKNVKKECNNLDIVKEFQEVIDNFKESMKELYEREENKHDNYIVKQYSEDMFEYALNNNIQKSIEEKYEEKRKEEIEKLYSLINEVDAMLSLSDDSDYQFEILRDYEIIDENNKVNA